MRLGNFTKTPAEVKRYKVEYSDWLDTGEYVQSVVLTVTPTSPSNPLTAAANSIGASATSFAFFVAGGVTGTVYTVDIRVTTTGGQIKEDTILFTVRDA